MQTRILCRHCQASRILTIVEPAKQAAKLAMVQALASPCGTCGRTNGGNMPSAYDGEKPEAEPCDSAHRPKLRASWEPSPADICVRCDEGYHCFGLRGWCKCQACQAK